MVLLALLLIAAPTADGYPTTRGTAGASFGISGDAAPTVGLTYFVANDFAARIDAELFAPITPGGAGQNTLYSLNGALRFYVLKRSSAAVFLQPGVAIGRENSPAVSDEAAFFVRFGAGLGVEYFFASHFSVGAVLELSLKLANLNGPGGTPVYSTLSTGTSALSANIYF